MAPKENSEAKKMPPTPEVMRHFETHAMKIRQAAGVGPNCPLDPFRLEEELKIRISYPEEIAMPAEWQQEIKELNVKKWSGGALPEPLPDGRNLVILHPSQTVERARITILEEVAHLYYDHKPTILVNGIARAHYNEKEEQEAYWTGAAVLLPSKVVAMRVFSGKTAEEIAIEFGVSMELVEMRIKTLRLWGYRKK